MSASLQIPKNVIPGLVPGTHDLTAKRRVWVVGTRPAMTKLLNRKGKGPNKESSFFVLILGISSQNDHSSHHRRLPARRASRGGGACAAQAARPKGGGGCANPEEQFYCRTPRWRAARQSQCVAPRALYGADAGAEGRDPAGARQTAQSLRGDRRHAQTGRQPERAYARFAGCRPVAGRLERRLFLGEGGRR